MSDPGIKQHTQMAMGDENGMADYDFGVEKFSSPKVNGGPSGEKHLGDHERAGGPPHKGNQANPKHGWE